MTKEWPSAGGLRLTMPLSSDKASALLYVVSAFAYAVLTGADAVVALLSGGFFEHRSLTMVRIALLPFLWGTLLFGYTSAKALRELTRRAERGN